ncbi:MAG: hypothetical protein HWN81_05860 [Candidatus Lokiarchaeota archaeon]|nr:hypothetical protein [Candidatus Lokiarchaeota archaeon]
MRKKKVLIHSNFCKAFTGFGKNAKNILKHLYRCGKYDIYESANMKMSGDPSLDYLPWRCYGTVPQNYSSLQDEQKRSAGYGAFEIDNIVDEVRPDVYIGIEDIWAFTNFHHKPWWNKVSTMVWTTLDSLPILPQAVEYAPKIKNYYVWSSFAERAFKELGYDHVKTLRGSLDTENFYRLPEDKRATLRKYHGIKEEDFIVGFVFRNQLRKSVPNLLDGFKIFKKQNPNSKLLLHTHWDEGWDINRLLKEKGINGSDILTTYACSSCNGYHVRTFFGQEQECRLCKEKTFNTTNVQHGVSEIQLNEVYNLMDVYCHPFTSGGQEIPVQEAKLTELITLVTNYSCGEDSCSEESGGIPLNWHEYREPGTQFIKASTDADHIAEMLQKVFDMSKEDRLSQGKKSRQWVIDNFSVEVIGKKLEEFIDAMPYLDDGVDIKNVHYDDLYPMPQNLSHENLVVDLYKNILNDDVDHNTEGYNKWLSDLKSNKITQHQLYNHFITVAKKQNAKKPSAFEDVLSKDDKGKRVAVIIPESGTDLIFINSLLRNLQKKHKGHNIYIFTKPEFFEYIEDNPYVFKCMPYSNSLDNPISMEGFGKHEGYFEAAYYPATTTQRVPCYIHNGN